MNHRKTKEDERSGAEDRSRLDGQDKQQADLRNPAAEPLETPEGLQRPRRGPLDKDLGRGGQ